MKHKSGFECRLFPQSTSDCTTLWKRRCRKIFRMLMLFRCHGCVLQRTFISIASLKRESTSRLADYHKRNTNEPYPGLCILQRIKESALLSRLTCGLLHMMGQKIYNAALLSTYDCFMLSCMPYILHFRFTYHARMTPASRFRRLSCWQCRQKEKKVCERWQWLKTLFCLAWIIAEMYAIVTKKRLSVRMILVIYTKIG